MLLYTTRGHITITCNKRLAPYVEQEVIALGFEIEETFITGVRLLGTLNDCIKLNLNLRCASQVLYSLKQFDAPDADAIYSNLFTYPWEQLIPHSGYFSVTSNVQNDTINNNMFANLRVKDAIVDRMRDKTGKRPSTGAELIGVVVHLFWKHDVAEVFIDTSGDSLARHGYRKIPGRAPMLEALASSTIMATRWDKKSPFINPMCGSGTVAIEAALIATNTAPGLFRTNYAFMHLQGYDEEVYLHEMDILDKQIIDVPNLKIIATDYSDMAIENARKNAIAAGVAKMIQFSKCDFADTPVPQGGAGVMFVNPEYGERLGEETELEQTYKRIGDFMKQKCKGYYGYVFTGNLDLAKKIGLKTKRRIEFYTSTIDCRLLEYELYGGTREKERGGQL
ncbi:MAG: class I SAM-dependent RNA methyltransferase [Bacteroidetes bacterium]|nr:class I SAM-dependent RNA methyltransferase [Bacteroidota bacterium]